MPMAPPLRTLGHSGRPTNFVTWSFPFLAVASHTDASLYRPTRPPKRAAHIAGYALPLRVAAASVLGSMGSNRRNRRRRAWRPAEHWTVTDMARKEKRAEARAEVLRRLRGWVLVRCRVGAPEQQRGGGAPAYAMQSRYPMRATSSAPTGSSSYVVVRPKTTTAREQQVTGEGKTR